MDSRLIAFENVVALVAFKSMHFIADEKLDDKTKREKLKSDSQKGG